MKTFTIADIRSWGPCYDPSKHLPEGWTGTALDMLLHPTIPAVDKIWLCRRYAVMNAKGLRLGAADCAERAQTYPKNYTPDPRTLAAIRAARDFANELIGARVLEEHRKGARAAYAAAYAAYAADAADAYAAAADAYAAAAAADAAAYAAADAADADAYAAAADAAADAAYAAAAADAGARNKERQLQVDYLIRMCSECPDHFMAVEVIKNA